MQFQIFGMEKIFTVIGNPHLNYNISLPTIFKKNRHMKYGIIIISMLDKKSTDRGNNTLKVKEQSSIVPDIRSHMIQDTIVIMSYDHICFMYNTYDITN